MASQADIEKLQARTKAFAVAIVRFYAGLPKSTEAQVIGRQLLRSGTSIGAQHREAHRAKSHADFISKIEGCLQELEETQYWIEILVESGIAKMEAVAALQSEARQLIAIFITIARKVKARKA